MPTLDQMRRTDKHLALILSTSLIFDNNSGHMTRVLMTNGQYLHESTASCIELSRMLQKNSNLSSLYSYHRNEIYK